MTNAIGNGLGNSNPLGSAYAEMQRKIAQMSGGPSETQATAEFGNSVTSAIEGLDQQMRAADELHVEALKGEIDLHEVAIQLKQTELAFQYSMQVRNKFIDAYREVMRMSV